MTDTQLPTIRDRYERTLIALDQAAYAATLYVAELRASLRAAHQDDPDYRVWNDPAVRAAVCAQARADRAVTALQACAPDQDPAGEAHNRVRAAITNAKRGA